MMDFIICTRNRIAARIALLGKLAPVVFIMCHGLVAAHAELSSGTLPLHILPRDRLTSVLPPNVRPLFTPEQLVAWLVELDESPPQWENLHDPPGHEHGERLFALNRERDEKRASSQVLPQRVAFVWSGILRRFASERGGFTIAVGPELTSTAWGILRFKPMGLPDEMVAVPPPSILMRLQTLVADGKEVDIAIVFTGRLAEDESLIYAFSHDGNEEGMIMPVVHIDGMYYVLYANR